MDDLLSKRAHATQARRQAILLEIASLERQQQLPQKLFSTLNVQALWQALKSKVVMRGAYSALGRALAKQKPDTSMKVPSLGYRWLPGRDSNPRPGD